MVTWNWSDVGGSPLEDNDRFGQPNVTDPGPSRRPSARKPAPIGALEKVKKLRGDISGGITDYLNQPRSFDSIGQEYPEEPRKEFTPAAGPLPGSAPMGQGGRRSDGVVDPKNYDPINYRRETFPLKATPETAESTFSATEDAMRPPETRNYTGQDAKIVELMERQLASAEKARQEAKWMMLARMGFGMSSGRPDAMATSAQDALSFAARGNSDYNTAINQGVGNNLQYANLQRQRDDDAFKQYNADRMYGQKNRELDIQQKLAEMRTAAARGVNPADLIRERLAVEKAIREEFETLHGKAPDALMGAADANSMKEYNRKYEEFKKQKFGEYESTRALLSRGTALQPFYDQRSSWGDVGQ